MVFYDIFQYLLSFCCTRIAKHSQQEKISTLWQFSCKIRRCATFYNQGATCGKFIQHRLETFLKVSVLIGSNPSRRSAVLTFYLSCDFIKKNLQKQHFPRSSYASKLQGLAFTFSTVQVAFNFITAVFFFFLIRSHIPCHCSLCCMYRAWAVLCLYDSCSPYWSVRSHTILSDGVHSGSDQGVSSQEGRDGIH